MATTLASPELSITTVRTLAMDAVQKANSGHPGAPMGLAPVGSILFTKHLRHDPSDPASTPYVNVFAARADDADDETYAKLVEIYQSTRSVQDGVVEVTERDILTNLPYAPAAHLVFDHHHSETLRNELAPNHVIDASAPSAARVVYDHFGGAERYPDISDELMRAVTASATGLRTARRISHVFVMDVPTYAETLFITDAAINIFPDLDAKRDIVQKLSVMKSKEASDYMVELLK